MSKMRRVYLAARYSRRKEMQVFSEELKALGYVVTSRWITGVHETPEKRDGNGPNPYTTEERAVFAEEDLNDLSIADTIIAFTEPQGAKGGGRGGRHVEFGVALALGMRLICIGSRENVFHCLPQVEHHPTWNDAFVALAKEAAK